MATLWMTKGLPGSGKSRWAEEVVRSTNGDVVRVNKDLFRDMLHGGQWSKKNEKQVLKARNALVSEFLAAMTDVIVDDTNLAPSHETELRRIAAQHGAEFRIKDFTDVPVEECIENDLARAKSVGEKVIRKMHRQFLFNGAAGRPALVKPIPGLPSAIIVDIDGTVAIMGDRSPYDASLCHLDTPNRDVINLVWQWATFKDRIGEPHKVIFCSGRKEEHRPQTEAFLDKHLTSSLADDEFVLLMRADGDNRKDSIIKSEIYERHIQGQYNVEFVLDDRDQVVEAWRSLGLTCLQVYWGAF